MGNKVVGKKFDRGIKTAAIQNIDMNAFKNFDNDPRDFINSRICKYFNV